MNATSLRTPRRLTAPGNRSQGLFSLLIALAATVPGVTAPAVEFTHQRELVAALGDLKTPPTVYAAEGFADAGAIKPLFYQGLPYRGKPTRVFAWLGLPEKREGKIPGVVLVHGGGGTAFKEWVQKWNAHGFAAVSIAVEGQTDERIAGAPAGAQWQRHAFAGPARNGIYGDSSEPLADQWMYHAVAGVVLANSLLRSLPEVDATRVGVCGISWGGVITATVIGIDDRFAFAIPIYGCGHLADAANQYGRALGENALYRDLWDPMQRMARARLPVLWLSWPEDAHFPLDCQAASYRAAPGPRLAALIPGMKHSHPAGWNPPDSYAFAESIVRTGKPWCAQTRVELKAGMAEVGFVTAKPLDRAVLLATADSGFTGSRKWTESPARLEKRGDTWLVRAAIPTGTTAWFVNARSGELTASSDYQEINPSR